MKYFYKYETLLGSIILVEKKGELTNLYFNNFESLFDYNLEETILIREAKNQLFEYFRGERKNFELPLNPLGTAFQKKVWNVLSTIPYGQTISYKDLAIKCGNSRAARAVGMANNKNPLPILIPCHRVIKQSGFFGGYSGGVEKKKILLNIEGIYL